VLDEVSAAINFGIKPMERTTEQIESEILSCFESHYIKEGLIDPNNIDYSYVFHYVTDEEKGPLDRELQRKSAIQHFSALLQAAITRDQERIKRVICDDLKFCDAKKDEKVGIIKATMDGILSAALSFPVPIVTLWEFEGRS